MRMQRNAILRVLPVVFFYSIVGIFGVTLAALFLVLPATFIATLAGLALLGTIGSSLANALTKPNGRETALITFFGNSRKCYTTWSRRGILGTCCWFSGPFSDEWSIFQ